MAGMRPAIRACARFLRGDTWPTLVFLLYVGMVFRFAHLWMHLANSETQVTGSTLLDLWLLVVLIALFVVWAALVRKGRWSVEAGAGLRLAGYGVLCRGYCDFLVFGVAADYGLVHGGRSEIETYAGAGLRALIAVHRWGGLLAFALGVAWFLIERGREAPGR